MLFVAGTMLSVRPTIEEAILYGKWTIHIHIFGYLCTHKRSVLFKDSGLTDGDESPINALCQSAIVHFRVLRRTLS